jgi:hypothetical protein
MYKILIFSFLVDEHEVYHARDTGMYDLIAKSIKDWYTNTEIGQWCYENKINPYYDLPHRRIETMQLKINFYVDIPHELKAEYDKINFFDKLIN